MPVRVTVDNRIRVSGLPPEAAAQLKALFDHDNPDYWKAKRFGFRRRVPKKLSTWRDDVGGLSVPRGGMVRLRTVLKEHNLATGEIEDERALGRDVKIPPHRVEHWPFQAQQIEAMRLHQTGLLRSSAGSGKSTAALGLTARLGLSTLVVVWNAALLRQWVLRVSKELGVPESWVGIIQGQKHRLGPVTIAMQQTLAGCADDYADDFGLVIGDEVHRAASAGMYAVFDALRAKYRLGLSDDERRKDRKEFLTYDLFGEVVAEAKHQDLVDGGYILDVEIRVVPTEFRAPWYAELDEEADELDQDDPRQNERWQELKRRKAELFDRLLEEMCADKQRAALIAGFVCDEVILGEQALVMTHRIEHVHRYDRLLGAAGLRTGFVLGGADNKVEYQRTIERLGDGSFDAAVGTYQAIGTGIDLPKVAVGVLASPVANSADGRSQFKQFRGRFARTAEGKAAARLYYPFDLHVYGAKPLVNLCRWSRSVKVLWKGDWRPGREVLKEIQGAKKK